ncbi:MAG: hypothetical protein CFH08_00268 [Alphaproteobacteria bacterium MarineAlpha3_Bin7]|nr:MAG: hypothetical protein CFH08_00268 [Alphaproteobacteria bacterium MarineAlpha3_Bin7]
MIENISINIDMWITFIIIFIALIVYASERLPVELTSIAIVCVFMLYFYIFPVPGDGIENLLSPKEFVLGFANSALLAVLALLVMGQGMVSAGVIDKVAHVVLRLSGSRGWIAVLFILLVVLAISGFLNNIPVVVIFIPIMDAIASKFYATPSKIMMPLSFAAVLGGMTTLIGSGTNLLVSGALEDMGQDPFSFFQFTLPGLVLAFVGFLFVFFILPRLLPNRSSNTEEFVKNSNVSFLSEITVSEGSLLVDLKSETGIFGAYPDLILRVIERGDDVFLPPFEGIKLKVGDVLVVTATREALEEAISHDPNLLIPRLQDEANQEVEKWNEGDRVLVEVMVRPDSNLVQQTLSSFQFRQKFNCVVLGIERRSRRLKTRISKIPIIEGDVLLIQGQTNDIKLLRNSSELVVLEWSSQVLPKLENAKKALIIFFLSIGAAVLGYLPIMLASLCGAVAMVFSGVLNIKTALKAVDTKIFTMIPAALAMGLAMQGTGGAKFLSSNLIFFLGDESPYLMLSFFFLLVAIISNLISAKAAAVLFTPIAVGISQGLGVPVEPFAVAVIFAANCAIATPMGYQTSLLVMGPGHYTFGDFARGGIPLIIILWITFSVFSYGYYNLN